MLQNCSDNVGQYLGVRYEEENGLKYTPLPEGVPKGKARGNS